MFHLNGSEITKNTGEIVNSRILFDGIFNTYTTIFDEKVNNILRIDLKKSFLIKKIILDVFGCTGNTKEKTIQL